jgi:tetratricopeptide (TPR) repeat protein/transcriptional regulator with XRE-family HTH domain
MGNEHQITTHTRTRGERVPNERLRAQRLKKNWTQVYVATMIGTSDVEVSRWETGAAVPTLYFREQLCALFGTTAEELGFVSSAETVQETSKQANLPWNIPYRRNAFFTGREEALARITTVLDAGKAAVTSIGAISGLGGVGKTQVAVEYAYRHRDKYHAVFWAKADTHENLVADMVALANLLNLPQKIERDQGKIVQAVKRWLQAHSNWLLILDNVDDLTLVHEWLEVETGHVLLTTRSQFTGTLAQTIDLERMSAEEGSLFLLHRSKLLAPDTTLEEAPETLRSTALTLVELLDGLPLALDQAGAYIEETGCSLSDYLERYQQQRAALLARRGRMGADHPYSVMTTLTMACVRVDQANPAALELLRLCAFLHADAIPEEMITEATVHLGPVLQPVATDPLQLDEAITTLRAYSLIRRDPVSKILNIHRLVQAVLKERMDETEQQEWISRVIKVINWAFPKDMRIGQWNVEDWQRCERLLPHALECITPIKHWNIILPEAASLLLKTATYLHNRGQFSAAEPLYYQALQLQEQLSGSEHPDVASLLCKLAELYRDQGKYEESISLCQRALHIQEQVLGPEHPEVTWPLHGLALLYNDKGRYAEAEQLFERVLRIREQALGGEHPDSVYPLNNLAVLYFNQDKYAEAEPLLKRAIHIQEQALGQEHFHLAFPLANLAIAYYEQGKYSEVEPLLQRALRLQEQTLGPEHPQLAFNLNNLAALYYYQGKYAEAEPLFLRALHIREQTMGPEHSLVARSLEGLASLYRDQGKYTEAESLFLRALHIREQQLGLHHAETAESLHDLAVLYHVQGKVTEAESFYLQALSIREQLGTQPTKTRETLERYIALLQETHREDEAAGIKARFVENRL